MMPLASFSSHLSSLRRLLPLAPLLLLPALPTAAPAQTSSPSPTVITSAPYTISTAGQYILGNNVINAASATTPAITINANNVVLDLNEYRVSGGSAQYVIEVNNRVNVTIKNGTVSVGMIGIYFGNASTLRDLTVSNVTVTHCILSGVEIDAAAPGSVVNNCVFTGLGVTTSTGTASSSNVYALSLSGGVRVVDNTIDTASTSASSYGVYSTANDLVIGNTISNLTYGIYYTSTATGETAGKYLNNLLFNCTNPFTNGVNATGNN